MNKILKSAFVALIATMGLTMTSCVNEYDYDGANAVGEQVYFGADMGKVIETPKSASSFSVMVRRINTHGALTVPVTITQSEGSIYTPAAQ
jgi:predicted secreted protein